MTNLQFADGASFNGFISNFSSVSYSNLYLTKFLKDCQEAKKNIAERLGLDEDGRLVIPVSIEKETATLENNMNKFFEEACGYTLYVHIRNHFSVQEAVENSISSNKTFETARGEEVQLQKGMKFSKAIGKIMEKLRYSSDRKDEILTKYSQVLNEKTLRGKLVISVNPYDFYSMSIGENWSSCLSPDAEYSSGTFSYASDAKTFVAYLISSSQDPRKDEIINKKWRKLFVLTDTKFPDNTSHPALLSSRGYPFDSPELTEEVVKNIWSKIGSTDEYEVETFEKAFGLISNKNALNSYSDFSLRNSCLLYVDKSIRKEIPRNSIDASSGSLVDCLACDNHPVSPESGICPPCLGYSFCDDCGGIAYESYETHNGNFICEDCADDYVYPEDGDSLYSLSEVQWVESVGGYITDHGIENYYFRCSECSELHHDSEMCAHKGRDYCENCFTDIEDEEEELEATE